MQKLFLAKKSINRDRIPIGISVSVPARGYHGGNAKEVYGEACIHE